MSKAEKLTLLGSSKQKYPETPDEAVLETFPNIHPDALYVVELECPEFTSLCPKTGQPDFAKLTICYVPDKNLVESKALKLFLFSFRNHGEFHEDVTNTIAKRLWDAMEGCKAMVIRGDFYPRGGISINPTVVRIQEHNGTPTENGLIAYAAIQAHMKTAKFPGQSD